MSTQPLPLIPPTLLWSSLSSSQQKQVSVLLTALFEDYLLTHWPLSPVKGEMAVGPRETQWECDDERTVDHS